MNRAGKIQDFISLDEVIEEAQEKYPGFAREVSMVNYLSVLKLTTDVALDEERVNRAKAKAKLLLLVTSGVISAFSTRKN